MTPGDLRRGVCGHLRETLPENWTESAVPLEEMLRGLTRLAPPAWAVALGDTTPADGRQVRAGAVVTQTEILVRYVVPLRADGTAPDETGETDQDLALDLEAELVDRLLGCKTQHGERLPLTWRGVTDRAVVGDGSYQTALLRWTCLHVYPGV